MSSQDKANPTPGAASDVKKANLLSKSKDFLQGAVDSISGKELPRLVEDFTRDMVIVAEGLSQDQEALRTTLNIQAQEQDKLAQSLRETARTSCMVITIVAGSVIFGHFLAVTRLPYELATWLTSLPLPPWAIVSLIILFYLLAGCFVDALGLVHRQAQA
ncbi:MAG TPA: TRAP transporter large permease subunit, partial [Clostridia bacterium]|nr:TRAP transporter large permease subunit [Clostridia bacterium]